MARDQKTNILLVDDRPENLLALEAVLEPLDQNLVKASSGEEALKSLLTVDFALILLDVQMPGIDGFETATLIKAREKTRHVPIIFLTAISKEPHHALRGYSVGAVDYLFKPFDPGVLRSKVEVFIDLYHLKREAEQLAHRALHDDLTGLPNRALFRDRLEMALARIRRRAGKVGVLFLDLDGFKLVNDGLGHDAGDRLLIQVAERLTNTLRPSDTVARFGGDEFTVLSDGIADDADVIDIADRISSAISAPFDLGEGEVTLSASIGIAIADSPEASVDGLMRDADAAMYKAKERGRARHETFDGAVSRRAAAKLEMETALHKGLDRGEFEVHYQPIVGTDSGEVIGMEALIRWQHPERGLLEPEEFMPAAEHSGFILALGQWALEVAFRQEGAWRRARPDARPLMMAVNLSARQLAQPELVASLSELIDSTGSDPTHLCLEIAESVVMKDAEGILTSLHELKALGVSLAIDDFGTGYSSLKYLKRFPMDILKIDRSFVEGLTLDAHSSSIAAAVVSLAHVLGLTATAEGVESEVQLQELRKLGCDQAQGHLWAVPEPASKLSALLEENTGPLAAELFLSPRASLGEA